MNTTLTNQEAYCLRCKDRQGVTNPKIVQGASGRSMLKGICGQCGGGLSRPVKSETDVGMGQLPAGYAALSQSWSVGKDTPPILEPDDSVPAPAPETEPEPDPREPVPAVAEYEQSPDKEPEQLSALRVLARICDIPVHIKTLQRDWMTLTYDLAVTDKGNQARRDFLDSARRIGVVPLTESCYLLPWTPEANTTVLNIFQAVQTQDGERSHGKVWVLHSQTSTEQEAQELSDHYDNGLREQIEKLAERCGRILDHASKGKDKLAEKMMDKTWETFYGLSRACVSRGSESLARELNQVRVVLQAAQAVLEGEWDNPSLRRVMGR